MNWIKAHAGEIAGGIGGAIAGGMIGAPVAGAIIGQAAGFAATRDGDWNAVKEQAMVAAAIMAGLIVVGVVLRRL